MIELLTAKSTNSSVNESETDVRIVERKGRNRDNRPNQDISLNYVK